MDPRAREPGELTILPPPPAAVDDVLPPHGMCTIAPSLETATTHAFVGLALAAFDAGDRVLLVGALGALAEMVTDSCRRRS